MAAQTSVFLFGHSFPARLHRQAREQHLTAKVLIGLSDRFSIFVEGHPGLTYRRIFDNLPHYLAKLQRESFDVLLIDLGTNDLCNPNDPPDIVVQYVVRFLDHLKTHSIIPKKIVFLSVLKRSSISRASQVSCTNFNHRVKTFNGLLSAKLKDYPEIQMYQQRRVNNPRFFLDGCHLNPEGMLKYFRGIKEAIYRCKL